MTTRQTDVLELEVRVKARPETIFPFLVDPEKMLRWKGIEARLEPRPGGLYRVDMGNDHVMHGAYVEVVPDRRVMFTFGWEGQGPDGVPPGSTTVEIDLIPQGAETIVRLRHSGLPGAEAREQHGHGWRHYLDRLAIVATGGDPGRDTMPDQAREP